MAKTGLIALFLLLALGCANEQSIKLPGNPPIEFATPEEWQTEERRIGKPAGRGPGKYETWERLHGSVVRVAEKYGTASWDTKPLPDFYFSGDWFDENRDSFALQTTRGVSASAWRDFQQAVAAHGATSELLLVGQESSIEGLEILITAQRILVRWQDKTPRQCQQKLAQLKLRLD